MSGLFHDGKRMIWRALAILPLPRYTRATTSRDDQLEQADLERRSQGAASPQKNLDVLAMVANFRVRPHEIMSGSRPHPAKASRPRRLFCLSSPDLIFIKKFGKHFRHRHPDLIGDRAPHPGRSTKSA
jgi:hypothetical protein